MAAPRATVIAPACSLAPEPPMSFQHVEIPPNGEPIASSDGSLQVPPHPIIPFIEGDGTGPDIWRAAVRVLDAAVEKSYAGDRRLMWMELFAGQKAFDRFGNWLPEETVEAF